VSGLLRTFLREEHTCFFTLGFTLACVFSAVSTGKTTGGIFAGLAFILLGIKATVLTARQKRADASKERSCERQGNSAL
jgi:mannose/fructose/N-acetylgalactosamine-specific phosphotransferase system component IIC